MTPPRFRLWQPFSLRGEAPPIAQNEPAATLVAPPVLNAPGICPVEPPIAQNESPSLGQPYRGRRASEARRGIVRGAVMTSGSPLGWKRGQNHR
jgi:hypothetical protein